MTMTVMRQRDFPDDFAFTDPEAAGPVDTTIDQGAIWIETGSTPEQPAPAAMQARPAPYRTTWTDRMVGAVISMTGALVWFLIGG